ncbi:MAG TPA: hypothetical protein VNM47_10590 [Terriglobia bacterium]|nr:hypothetical protein [Terriglobia bacterium]
MHIHWVSDGRAIGYVNTVKGVPTIWTQPLAGSPPKPVTLFTSGQSFNFSVAQRRSALADGSQSSELVLIRNFPRGRGGRWGFAA